MTASHKGERRLSPFVGKEGEGNEQQASKGKVGARTGSEAREVRRTGASFTFQRKINVLFLLHGDLVPCLKSCRIWIGSESRTILSLKFTLLPQLFFNL